MGIDERKRTKNVSLFNINKSSLWEGTFADDEDVNCTSFEIVFLKKIFDSNLFWQICSTLIGFGIYWASLS